MMNAHEPTADKIDVEDDKIGGMKWDEITTKGYKGKIKALVLYLCCIVVMCLFVFI